MTTTTTTYLGSPDRYARRDRIQEIDPNDRPHEVAFLFFQDFAAVMTPQFYTGLMFTYSAPRMSRILASTGELEHRLQKRIVDMVLLSKSVTRYGLEPGPGRDAARRVNALHRLYDPHPDDFSATAADEVLVSLALADKYGWRPVTEPERVAVRLHFFRQARAFGSKAPVLESEDEVHAFMEHYLDEQVRYAEQNERLANVLTALLPKLMPTPPGAPTMPQLFSNEVDDRVLLACGQPLPDESVRAQAAAMLRADGQKGPTPDDAPDSTAALAASVYPDGWDIATLGPPLGLKADPALDGDRDA